MVWRISQSTNWPTTVAEIYRAQQKTEKNRPEGSRAFGLSGCLPRDVVWIVREKKAGRFLKE
jgi:hypothetical protein